MTLSADENDLLQRIREKPELRPIFFRKVRGLKWFNALKDEGYFSPEQMPRPTPAKDEGYVNIPRWDALEYLTRIAEEIDKENTPSLSHDLLEIIQCATNYAKNHNFSNYQVWWQLSNILILLPPNSITQADLDIIDYWLDDRYDRALVADVIGSKWIYKLLDIGSTNSLNLANKTIEIIFKVSFTTETSIGRDRKIAQFRFDHQRAKKIQEKVCNLSGRKLGVQAVDIFRTALEQTVNELKNNGWSSLWQPAIEQHKQNKYHDDAENILVYALRDSLLGYLEEQPGEAVDYISELLSSPLEIINRIAIYCISHHHQVCEQHIDSFINPAYFKDNFRHEIWHFLNKNYTNFRESQKENVLFIISGIEMTDDDGKVMAGATAYKKSLWLSAIKDFGEQEEQLYHESIGISGTEPDHPDFSSFTSSSAGGQLSPFSVEELSSLSITELSKTLSEYECEEGWQETGIEGLTRTVKQVFKNNPLLYIENLNELEDLDLAFIYSFIESYRELWTEKTKLPWEDIWPHIIEFISRLITQERFWDTENAKNRTNFIANRHWVVGSIGNLIESGAQSDEHAMPQRIHELCLSTLEILLERQEGEDFEVDSDAVSIAINSPRGRCIRALINLSLRDCRLEDSGQNRAHKTSWELYRPYFDKEIARSENSEYEFTTLAANYLPNFLYMSRDWTLGNLNKIFDQTDDLKWSCAMQGYSYVNIIHREIYDHLKENGDFLKALENEKIKDRINDRIIENIVAAYIGNYEKLNEENSLIRITVEKFHFEEISHLIWVIWTRRSSRDDLLDKVFELWPLLLSKLDLTDNKGIKLASQLCKWATFIEQIDGENKKLLLTVAPYADEAHNSYELLKSLARLSSQNPFDANDIWQAMLSRSPSYYPEEAVKTLLANLVSRGTVGIRAARNTVSLYIEYGSIQPSEWLREIA